MLYEVITQDVGAASSFMVFLFFLTGAVSMWFISLGWRDAVQVLGWLGLGSATVTLLAWLGLSRWLRLKLPEYVITSYSIHYTKLYDKRVFLLNNVHENAPVAFETRWVLSYLSGPLTREQIKRLMADKKSAAAPAAQITPGTLPQPATASNNFV